MDFYEPAWTTQRDPGLVWRDVGRKHGIVFVADAHDLFSSDNVPDDYSARLTTNTTADNKQLAVATKSHFSREAVRERQNAQKLQGVGIVEQDLFLSGKSHQRRPRTAGQSNHRIQMLGVHNWQFRKLCRHRRRTFGFTIRGQFYRQI